MLLTSVCVCVVCVCLCVCVCRIYMLHVGCADDDMSLTCLRVQPFLRCCSSCGWSGRIVFHIRCAPDFLFPCLGVPALLPRTLASLEPRVWVFARGTGVPQESENPGVNQGGGLRCDLVAGLASARTGCDWKCWYRVPVHEHCSPSNACLQSFARASAYSMIG